MAFLGSDTACVSDLSRVDVQVTDPRQVIGQRIARRWTTPRGGLASVGGDPAGGWDVRQYVNAKLAPNQIVTAENQLRLEALKDQEVGSAAVRMRLNAGNLTINGSFTSGVGPFSLTLNVSDLTTDLIFTFGGT